MRNPFFLSPNLHFLRPSLFSQFIKYILLLILSLGTLSGCVIEEDLSSTYNQAHIGLNEWNFEVNQSSNRITFNLGYLIGISDVDGVDEIRWNYRLVTLDQQDLAQNTEVMRNAELGRQQIFVQGQRERFLDIPHTLTVGQNYVLWFTLYYRDEVLKEKLFSVEAGTTGGDPTWVNDLPGANGVDVGELLEGTQASGQGPESLDSTESDSIEPTATDSIDSNSDPDSDSTPSTANAGGNQSSIEEEEN